MLVAGAIEVVAGLLVAVAPRVGSYLVMLWLWGIVINLLLIPGYYDIALRDFGLSLDALAFARLSAAVCRAAEEPRIVSETPPARPPWPERIRRLRQSCTPGRSPPGGLLFFYGALGGARSRFPRQVFEWWTGGAPGSCTGPARMLARRMGIVILGASGRRDGA